jgi:hypothetical protein
VPALVVALVVLVVIYLVVVVAAFVLPLLTAVVGLAMIAAALVAVGPLVLALRREVNKRYRSTSWPTWNSRMDVIAQHLIVGAAAGLYTAVTAFAWMPEYSSRVSEAVTWCLPALIAHIWNVRVGIRRIRAASSVASRPVAEWLPGGRSQLPAAYAPTSLRAPAGPLPSWAQPLTATLDDVLPVTTAPAQTCVNAPEPPARPAAEAE